MCLDVFLKQTQSAIRLQLPRHMLMSLSEKHDHTIFPVELGAFIDLLSYTESTYKNKLVVGDGGKLQLPPFPWL